MTQPRFRPFETHLDEQASRQILAQALAHADDGELFLENRVSEAITFDDGRVKNASFDVTEGFGPQATPPTL